MYSTERSEILLAKTEEGLKSTEGPMVPDIKYVCVYIYIYMHIIHMKGRGVSVRAEKEPERYGGIGGWGRSDGL